MTETTTTSPVVEAMEIIIQGMETRTIPEGLEDFKYSFGHNPYRNQPVPVDRHIPASILYDMLARILPYTLASIKRQVRELVGTEIVKRGDSTATTYTLRRVIDEEKRQRAAVDVQLRELATRLEAHGLEVVYRTSGYSPDVTDVRNIRPGDEVRRITLATPLAHLAEIMDALANGR